MKMALLIMFMLGLTMICVAQAPGWEWANPLSVESVPSTSNTMVKDNQGNIYIVMTFSSNLTLGNYTLSSSGMRDICVAKMDASGNWLWASRIGGPNMDQARGITIDPNGSIYVIGTFFLSTTIGNITLSGYEDDYYMRTDTFIAKMDANGNWLWAVSGSGPLDDNPNGITVDSSGNVIVVGTYEGSITFGNVTLTGSDEWSYRLYIIKLDANGNVLWAKHSDGGGRQRANGVAVDGTGNIYVTGGYENSLVLGSITLSCSGYSDIFTVKLSPAGNWIWANRAGSTNSFNWTTNDEGRGIKIDASGNIYITGTFLGTAIFGTYSLTSGLNTGSDVFVAKMSNNGIYQWASGSSGTGENQVYAIDLDSSGNSYITGRYKGPVVFGSTSLVPPNGFYHQLFVAKYNLTGNLLWLKHATCETGFWGASLVADQSGNCYVASNGGNNRTFDEYINSSSGSSIAKLNPNYLPLPYPPMLVSPSNGTTSATTDATLNWSASSSGGAPANYKLYFGTNNPPTNIVNGTNLGNVLSFNPPNLLNVLTTYYWKIIPLNATGEAQNCPVWSFTVRDFLPNPATLIYPSNGAVNIPRTPTLSWNPPVGGGMPTGFILCTGTTPSVGGAWSQLPATQTTFQYNNASSYSATYYWKIIPLNATGEAEDCPVWSFTTIIAPPNPATVVSPSNEASDVPLNSALTWNAPTSGGTPASYKLFLGTDNPPTNMVNGTNLGNVLTYTSPTNFYHGTQYYWKIVPTNANRDAIGCPIWSFITAPAPPNPATLVSPQNGAVNVFLNESLSWLAPQEGSIPTDYKLFFGTNNPPSNIVNGTNLGNVLIYTHPVDLYVNTTYYWKIVPTNAGGMAPNCPVWSFTTPTHPIPYQELFNSSTFPNGWTQTYDGTIPSNRWSVSNTSYSGGTAYEMEALWCEGTGTSRLISPTIYIGDVSDVSVQFKQYFDDYAPGVTAKIQYSYDLSTWFDTSFIYLSGQGDLTTEARANIFNLVSDLIHIAWVLDGDHYQYDLWYIDNVVISEYVPPETVALPHYESFNPEADLSDWLLTISGNVEESPWEIWNTNYAGGQPNELGASYVSGTGTSRLISPALDTQGVSAFTVSFAQYYQDYGVGITATLQYSHDMLSWHDTHWSIEGSRWNHTDGVSVLINNINAPVTYVAWTLIGNHFQFDYWYIDNVAMELPQSHDVAPVCIDIKPIESVNQFIPNGKVINMGTNPEIFDVTLDIGGFYASTVQASANPGEIVELSFAPLSAEVGWTYFVVMTTTLPTDQNQNNDTMRSNISVLPLNKTGYADVASDWIGGYDGPASFRLDNPENLVDLPGTGADTSFISGADWIGNGWYGAEHFTDPNTDRWWRINHTTGFMTHLGNHGTLNLTGIAYDDSRDITYACTTTHLYTVNRITGVTTMVGPFNYDSIFMIAIAYHPTEDLIVGVDLNYAGVWLIDRLTGNATWNGYLGISVNYAQDIAFDRDTGYLYLAGYTVGPDAGGALYWIDYQRGAIKIGNFPGRNGLSGFAIPHGISEPPVLTLDYSGTLSWQPVPGVIEYKIYASDSPDSGFLLIATTASTTWSDPAFPQDRRFYRVCANSNNSRANGIVQERGKPESKIPVNKKRSIPQIMNTDTPQTDRARF